MNISTNAYAKSAKANTASIPKGNRQGLKSVPDGSKVVYTQDQLTVSSDGRSKSVSAQAADTENLITNNPGSQTDFIFSPVAKLIKYTKAINEHYAKQNEENLKFSNPSAHIYDKYFNKNSKYYIKGLTNAERELCADNENMVLNGLPAAVSNFDPVIQNTFGGLNVFTADVEYNREVREKTNESIHRLFAENGITIPEDADLKLMVDPYDFKIHASGVDDELARAIETALNKGKNGVNLYYQMEFSNPGVWGLPQASQFKEGMAGKRAIFHVVKELTGYDIREMDYKDGKIYTPDGEDLWKVLTEKAQSISAAAKTPFPLSEYSGYYDFVAQLGWEAGEDFNLTIGYKNGSLYDIDTEYGYGPGQTDWQDELFNQVKKQQEAYRAEREETLRREENDHSSIFTGNSRKVQYSAREIVEDVPNVEDPLKQIGLYGSDGKLYPLKPISQDTMDMINRLIKNGLKPLNKDILSLPR